MEVLRLHIRRARLGLHTARSEAGALCTNCANRSLDPDTVHMIQVGS